MRCPPIQRCAVCNELLIHRGKRSIHESASYLGQIVHNLLPPDLSFIDIDGAMYKRSTRLLRFFEHKSPGQELGKGQRELLLLLARLIQLVKESDEGQHLFGSPPFALHPQSGVYVMRGDPHEGNQLGEAVVTRFPDLRTVTFRSEEDALCWMALLEGTDREFVREKLRRRRIQPAPPKEAA